MHDGSLEGRYAGLAPRYIGPMARVDPIRLLYWPCTRADTDGMFCPRCGRRQEPDHRFCPACGRALPGETDLVGPKVTQLFLGIPAHGDDPADPVLRVSWYLDEHVFAAPEGDVTVPGHHVRFSIWFVDRPVCAMSLPEEEAIRLADFLAEAARLSASDGSKTQADELA
jgi:hypothetical protein